MHPGKFDRALLLYKSEVEKLLGLNQHTMMELSKRADFPRRVKVAGKRPMYIRAEIELWITKLERV